MSYATRPVYRLDTNTRRLQGRPIPRSEQSSLHRWTVAREYRYDRILVNFPHLCHFLREVKRVVLKNTQRVDPDISVAEDSSYLKCFTERARHAIIHWEAISKLGCIFLRVEQSLTMAPAVAESQVVIAL